MPDFQLYFVPVVNLMLDSQSALCYHNFRFHDAL